MEKAEPEPKKGRAHLESALAHLEVDEELKRMVNPRHTDQERGYLVDQDTPER
jgi:hypothetical protein